MPNLVKPQPGDLSMSGPLSAGTVTVSQDQNTITGIINKTDKIQAEYVEGPPSHYRSDGPPVRVFGFADDGTGVATEGQQGADMTWTQP